MDPKQKSLLIKIGIGVAALFGVAYMASDDGEKEANEAARIFTRKVMVEVNRASEVSDKQASERYDYKVEDLLSRLDSYLRRLERLSGESIALAEDIEQRNDEPQPQHVIDDCRGRKEQVKRLNAEIRNIQVESEEVYRITRQEWEARAAEPDKDTDELSEAEKICEELLKYKEQAEKLRDQCKAGWEARGIYNRLIKRLKIKEPQIRAQLDKCRAEIDAARAARNQVIGEGNLVDDSKPKMKEINAVMDKIRTIRGGNEEVALPELKSEPKPLPPPEFKPDLVLVATGDLPETLLRPLVESWLTERQATPSKGSSFIWDTRNGNKELEVNVPSDMQGATPGKLALRIVPEQNALAAFESVGNHGNAHLLLTGVEPSREMLACWLPEGANHSEMGRTFKARVCYDALVFFSGRTLKLTTPLRSAEMKKLPIVYSVNDAARVEAAQVFNLSPREQDAVELKNLSVSELCNTYSDKMILGVRHKDAARAISFSDTPTICYAAGWESEEAFKVVPAEYRPRTDGVAPTPANIATGRYAYSYSIYIYRSTRNTESTVSALAADLLAYMADAENYKVAQKIRDAGFVPVELGVDKLSRTNELTRDDLPIPVLLEAMGADAEKFGYDKDDANAGWVYGVRIPFAMYFKTGSSKGEAGQVSLDADATYYTSTQAFLRIQELVENERAAVVVLGHADIQHKGDLKVDLASWLSNLTLSQKRAGFVGKELQNKFPASSLLRHVAIGTGWARPACDISLTKSVAEQENELARCRRAEVFIVFPVPGSGQ